MRKNCFVTRMVTFLLAMAVMAGAMAAGYVGHPKKAYAQEYLYTGTLDISAKGWTGYNTGLNYDMTGGTAGTIRQGAKLLVISEQVNRAGNKVSYVYSEDLQKKCYVTSKYIVKDAALEQKVEDEQDEEKKYGVLDISSKGWKSYNTGLNYNMTGGTAGNICQGAKLTVVDEKTNIYGTKVSYCYSEDLQKYCYITSSYIRIVETAPETKPEVKPEAEVKPETELEPEEQPEVKPETELEPEEAEEQEESYREKIAAAALLEYELYGGKKLAEPIQYNYNYTKKAGGTETLWCADFVCWCAEQAGIPMSVFPHEKDSYSYAKTEDGYSHYGRYYNGYSLAYVPDLVNYLTKYCGATYYAVGSAEVKDGSYTPKPGDLIVYRTGQSTYQHVGLVVGYDASTKKVTTVEGNTTSGSYKRGCIAKKVRVYNRAKVDSDWYIQGYVSPNYEE